MFPTDIPRRSLVGEMATAGRQMTIIRSGMVEESDMRGLCSVHFKRRIPRERERRKRKTGPVITSSNNIRTFLVSWVKKKKKKIIVFLIDRIP